MIRNKKEARTCTRDLALTTENCKSLIASTNSQHHLRKVFSSGARPFLPPASVHKTDSAQYSFKSINAHRRWRGCTPFGIDTNGSIICQSLVHISGLVPNIDRNLVMSVAKATTVHHSISCLPSERNVSGWNIFFFISQWCHWQWLQWLYCKTGCLFWLCFAGNNSKMTLELLGCSIFF